jgi:hypothetical protein
MAAAPQSIKDRFSSGELTHCPDLLKHYQRMLDTVSRAFWHDDHLTLARHISVPLHISTDEMQHCFTDTTSAVSNLHNQVSTLREMGVTDYHQIAQQATLCPTDENTLLGWHKTYVIRSGSFAFAPITTEMKLVRHQFFWKMSCIHTSARNSDINAIGPQALRPLEQAQ